MKSEKRFESKNEKELISDAGEYARKAGIKLNPDKKIVGGVVKGLFKHKKEKGEFYCPCRIPTGDKEKDKEIICPCVFHRGEIELQNHCKCLLFVSG